MSMDGLSKKDLKKNYVQYISDKMKFEQVEIISNSYAIQVQT